ncbi:dual specificity protein phosphatase family protein [Ruegeria sp. Ofav3-42]|uniref:protein-tyrosine phosphatase family protein n=1 Tax=Ruegeria sp. Ofav3-42 TaxID=2917759 RepID=UPI001EF60946|nr:dual specificity protein phosphatase family protein [Ruegeria sp. Ofav3-42]MCG7520715.1 dual specificity protein phosphatase family protein [Ruegeria sp. Ofav3-42]
MADFAIYALRAGSGTLALSPLPGGGGRYADDLKVIHDWRPDLVISMTTETEMQQAGAGGFGPDVQTGSAVWLHLPVEDFGAPPPEIEALWPQASVTARQVLSDGGRILVHCRGGCGRSGMVALRLMVENGEESNHALSRLRSARPCAVETDQQMAWAMKPTQGDR